MDPIGLIAAMPSESSALLRLVREPSRRRIGSKPGASFKVGLHECVLITSGMGIARAEAASRLLVEKVHSSCLISFGIAGAVRADLRIGDVIMANRTGLLENGTVALWRPLSKLSESTCTVVSKKMESHNVRFQHGTTITTRGSQIFPDSLEITNPILEMETAGILRTVEAATVPLIVIRSISDGPSAPLPLDLGQVIDANGNLLPGKMLLELVRHPGLLRLSGQMLKNSRIAADHAALAVFTALEQTTLF